MRSAGGTLTSPRSHPSVLQQVTDTRHRLSFQPLGICLGPGTKRQTSRLDPREQDTTFADAVGVPCGTTLETRV
ncbi:hypothetical protein CB1_000849030 [Camelus ferus]|nr:hypothetical protein CB1_000849030 [Camelus ferus]